MEILARKVDMGATAPEEAVERDRKPDQQGSLPSILSQLGLLLVPAGVIALFCQVLEVTPQITGAASLATVFLTGICIYRGQINRLVPSSLLAALLVGLAMLFFVNYPHILLKKTGLIKYYRVSNDYLAEIDPDIMQSQQEMWFYGVNFSISAAQRRDALLNRLANGVKIRYLILNPKSSRLDELAKGFDMPSEALRTESEKGFWNLLDLRKRWQETSRSSANPGELEIRIFDTVPNFRLYVFDPGLTRGRTYFIPYANAVRQATLPGYLLENIDTGVWKAYFDSVRKLWFASLTLDEFLRNHPEIPVTP